jgi:hypothetical protein
MGTSICVELPQAYLDFNLTFKFIQNECNNKVIK